jgi:putative phosphoesterase
VKIGIVSDSHDNVPAIRKAIARLKKEGCKAILHAGDFCAPFAAKPFKKDFNGPVIGVFGNVDGEKKSLAELLENVAPGPRMLRLGGKVIALAHSIEQVTGPMREAADVVVVGHTHLAGIGEGKKPLVINPGEVCGMLYDRSTVATLETASLTAKIVEL